LDSSNHSPIRGGHCGNTAENKAHVRKPSKASHTYFQFLSDSALEVLPEGFFFVCAVEFYVGNLFMGGNVGLVSKMTSAQFEITIYEVCPNQFGVIPHILIYL
jgi:hypothetical protein